MLCDIVSNHREAVLTIVCGLWTAYIHFLLPSHMSTYSESDVTPAQNANLSLGEIQAPLDGTVTFIDTKNPALPSLAYLV